MRVSAHACCETRGQQWGATAVAAAASHACVTACLLRAHTHAQLAAEQCSQLEPAKEHQGKAEPLFLFYRNGQLKARVAGANAPMLTSLVHELTPANAEADDLEVRGCMRLQLRLQPRAVTAARRSVLSPHASRTPLLQHAAPLPRRRTPSLWPSVTATARRAPQRSLEPRRRRRSGSSLQCARVRACATQPSSPLATTPAVPVKQHAVCDATVCACCNPYHVRRRLYPRLSAA